jgi:hypothetical protein
MLRFEEEDCGDPGGSDRLGLMKKLKAALVVPE